MTSPLPISTTGRRIRFLRGWAEQWEAKNPVLADGEPGIDKTRNMLKIGDGVTPWNDLDYLTPPSGTDLGGADMEAIDLAIAAAVRAHVIDTTPHAVYDDGPSLLLLWQNAKL